MAIYSVWPRPPPPPWRKIPGVEAVLRRVDEFDVVEKAIDQNDYMKQVRDSQKHVPVVTLDDVKSADGYLFGSPTRFGNMAAQMKQLFDTMGGLWMQGALEGKPAGVFTSTGSTHGGQETTIFTMMAPLLHLGMVVVGIPYSTEGLAHLEARGASPYGASTIAGTRGELQPAEQDLFFVARPGEADRGDEIAGVNFARKPTNSTLSPRFALSLLPPWDTLVCTRVSFNVTPQSGSPTILVVDDEPDVLRLVEAILNEQGYHVVTAKGADNAIRTFDRLSRKPTSFSPTW